MLHANIVIRGQVNFYDNNTGITTCELKQLLKKPQLQNSQNHIMQLYVNQNDENSHDKPLHLDNSIIQTPLSYRQLCALQTMIRTYL